MTKRSKVIHYLDDEGFGEQIPRVAGNGAPAVHNDPVDEKQWTPAFRSSVVDAMVMLRNGYADGEVRAKHGIIVLRTARYMWHKAKT